MDSQTPWQRRNALLGIVMPCLVLSFEPCLSFAWVMAFDSVVLRGFVTAFVFLVLSLCVFPLCLFVLLWIDGVYIWPVLKGRDMGLGM